jgi:hypothetical protein
MLVRGQVEHVLASLPDQHLQALRLVGCSAVSGAAEGRNKQQSSGQPSLPLPARMAATAGRARIHRSASISLSVKMTPVESNSPPSIATM